MDEPVFRERSEHELALLTDDELIAYLRRARAAGSTAAARLALQLLVFGYWDALVARAALKVPRAAAEDMAATALESAIKSAFDGVSVGELRSWLHTILARRIAEHYRSKEGRPRLVALISEHPEDEAVWGFEPSVDPADGTVVDVRRAVATAYAELSEGHRAVVDLYVLSEYSAAEAAAGTGEGENNVHQIGSRFRKRVRALRDEGDTAIR